MNRVAVLRVVVFGALLGVVSLSAHADEPYNLEEIQNQPFLPRGDLHPKDFRDISQWVEQLPQRNFDFNSIARRTLQLKQDNPTLSNDEIGKRLLQDFPGLSTADGLSALQKWAQQYQTPQLDLTRMIPQIPGSTPGGNDPPPLRWPPTMPPMGTDSRFPPPELRSLMPGGFPPVPGDTGLLPDEDIPSSIDRQEAEMLLRRQRQYLAIKQFWERNFGSMDRSPALRQLLLDMFVGADPMNSTAGDGLSALFGDENIDPNEFLGWLEGRLDLSELQLGDFKFFDFELPSLSTDDLRTGSFPAGDLAVSGSSFDLAELIILLLGIAAVAAAFWYGMIRTGGDRSNRVPGPEEWPIDPRTITDRGGVVTAFEFLSLKVCGFPARSWNHEQIADRFHERLGLDSATSPVNALVGLYVIARYAPVDDPFTPEMIAEARGHLCHLAGIPAP